MKKYRETNLREIERFVNKLRVLDGEELGLPVAIAANYRYWALLNEGVDLGRPQLAVLKNSRLENFLVAEVHELQRLKQEVWAMGPMIWLHSLRGASTLELRKSARNMWRELERGFEHCEKSSLDFTSLVGEILQTDNFDAFPEGLTPEVI